MLISVLLLLMALGGLQAALRKDAEYDAFVVSYGGSGCTSTIKRVTESHGTPPAPRLRVNVFNNQDRIKHAWPDHILEQTPSLTYGVVYVFGNMTSAVKSLCRRHYMRLQIGFMHGDGAWAEAQLYEPFPVEDPGASRKLFRKRPKWEAHDDFNVSASLPRADHPKALRVRRILDRAGATGVDPVGLWQHFDAWRTAAESGTYPYPILFVNIATTGHEEFPSFHKLAKFTDATVVPDGQVLYSAQRRKGADALELAVTGASARVDNQDSQSEATRVGLGVKRYDAWTEEMNTYDGRYFPGAGKQTPAWAK